MGLFAFNRMRLKLEEKMKPENIIKQEIEAEKAEEIKENPVVEAPVEEPAKTTVKRGSKRK